MSLATTQDAIHVSERMLAHLDKLRAFMVRYHDNPAFQKNVEKNDPAGVRSMALSCNAVDLWRSHGRQALAMHPGIVEETRLATSDKIHPEILRAIPYLNPLVVYPNPPVVKSWVPSEKIPGQGSASWESHVYQPGETLRLLGFLTYGHGIPVSRYTADQLDSYKKFREVPIADTHDPDASMLGVYCIFEVLDANGKVITLEENMLSIPMEGEPLTVREQAKRVADRYQWGHPSARGNPTAEKFLLDILQIVIGTLFYLCSTTLEAEKVSKKMTAKMKVGVARKPISLYKVGWQTGAAVSRYRHSIDTSEKPSTNRKGQEQDPQHRRAHFKTVWTGPGRSIPKTAFVSPYWTKRERLGPYGINTARRVI